MMLGVTWLGNILAIAVLPFKLGISNASAILFLSYCMLCGAVLTFAEDSRFIIIAADRSDVRGYLLVRVVMTLVLGSGPFLIGKAIA